MGLWAAAGAAALQVGTQLVGDKASQELGTAGSSGGGELQTPGYHKSGNVGAGNGYTERPALPEPLNKYQAPKNNSILSKTNNFLGSEVGHLTKGVGGSFLGDYRQRRNSRNRFKDLKSEGLTPQEIAGSSGGGAVQAQGNTLGSGPQVQAASQQAFQAGENAKQRAHEIRKIEVQKEVPRRQVSLAEKINPLQIQIMEQNKVLIGTQINKNINDLTYFWQKIFAVMSRENVMASVSAYVSDVSIKGILTGIGSAEERQAAAQLYDDLVGSNSRYLIEAVGIGGWLSRLFTNENIIGNKSNPSKINTTGQFLNKFNPFNLKVKGRNGN